MELALLPVRKWEQGLPVGEQGLLKITVNALQAANLVHE